MPREQHVPDVPGQAGELAVILASLRGRRPYHKGWRYAFRLRDLRRDLRAAFRDYPTWDMDAMMRAAEPTTPAADETRG